MPFLLSQNSLSTWRTLSTSPSSIFIGDITTFTSRSPTNGRQHSSLPLAYSNLPLYSLVFAMLPPSSRHLWITSSLIWLQKDGSRFIWMTLVSIPVALSLFITIKLDKFFNNFRNMDCHWRSPNAPSTPLWWNTWVWSSAKGKYEWIPPSYPSSPPRNPPLWSKAFVHSSALPISIANSSPIAPTLLPLSWPSLTRISLGFGLHFINDLLTLSRLSSPLPLSSQFLTFLTPSISYLTLPSLLLALFLCKRTPMATFTPVLISPRLSLLWNKTITFTIENYSPSFSSCLNGSNISKALPIPSPLSLTTKTYPISKIPINSLTVKLVGHYSFRTLILNGLLPLDLKWAPPMPFHKKMM